MKRRFQRPSEGLALTQFFARRRFGGFERGEQGLVACLCVLLFEVLAHCPIFLCLLLSGSPSMPVPWGTWALVSQDEKLLVKEHELAGPAAKKVEKGGFADIEAARQRNAIAAKVE